MSITLRNAGIALSLAVLAGTIPAIAQTPGGATQGTTPSAGATQGTKTPRAAGPAIVGSWSGQLTQINSQTPIKVELAIQTSTAQESSSVAGRRSHMCFSSKSSPRAGLTRVVAVRTAPSPLRGKETILPWGGSATSKIALSLPTALSQKSNSTERTAERYPTE
jgi:hypothetical protein